MSQTTLLFWSARFLIIGGIFLVSGINLTTGYTNDISIFNDDFYLPSVWLVALGAVFILMPFNILYAFQADNGGAWGFIGFIFAFIGLVSFGFGTLAISFIFPVLAAHSLETEALLSQDDNLFSMFLNFFLGGMGLMSLGFLFLGISGLKAKVYSSAVPILFILGAITCLIIPIQPYNLQVGLSLICLGIILAGSHINGEAKS